MKTLLICNDPPYATGRSWNGLRLAGALARRDGEEVRVFLLGDAVGCAVAGQKVPDGCYHLDQMISSAERHGAEVWLLRDVPGRPRHYRRSAGGPRW